MLNLPKEYILFIYLVMEVSIYKKIISQIKLTSNSVYINI